MYTTAQFETAVLNLNQDIRLQQISMTNDGRHVRKAWGYKGSKRVEWNSVGIAYLSGERTPSLDLSWPAAMGLYVDEDSRRLYSIQDLCIEEIEALRHAIDTAPPPYRATLERLRHHLASI